MYDAHHPRIKLGKKKTKEKATHQKQTKDYTKKQLLTKVWKNKHHNW